ncbi:MAG: DUF805 domain-containing protein [Burkholderiales bacterium]|uniref:DUF805 domain-containing protein n=1 Tax=Roseateles sp. TaxID=1971397 RepID=UPI000FBF5431|nr:MAG: DUF805 domain-containing protein [Burkholderiales bacterium]
MTFQESIRVCFNKYADFSGRASRSEYWWFFLFSILASLVAGAIGYVASTIVFLGLLLPSLAAATRRLHDTGKSGWWQLVGLIPVVGFIVLVVLLAMESRQPD